MLVANLMKMIVKIEMVVAATCESCGSIPIALVVFRGAESGLSAELVVPKCKAGVAKGVNL
jgi:hypothetical protein